MTQTVIFISYSHKDEKEKERLLSHLEVLKHQRLIHLWSDSQIEAGADWQQKIGEAITQADVAILLISANFLTSDFILGEEVPRLLQRRECEGLIVFPVIARACAWEAVGWLKKMKVRPRNGKPIWGASARRVDEDLADLAKEIASVIKPEAQDTITAPEPYQKPQTELTRTPPITAVPEPYPYQSTGRGCYARYGKAAITITFSLFVAACVGVYSLYPHILLGVPPTRTTMAMLGTLTPTPLATPTRLTLQTPPSDTPVPTSTSAATLTPEPDAPTPVQIITPTLEPDTPTSTSTLSPTSEPDTPTPTFTATPTVGAENLTPVIATQTHTPTPTSTPIATQTPAFSTPTATASVMAGETPTLEEQQLMVLINNERAQQGIALLTVNPVLAQLSGNFSSEMATRDFFDHDNPEGVGPGDRLTAAGYRWAFYGESLGAGFTSPQAVFDSWINSPPHRSILLDPKYTEIGIGYAAGGTWGHYWTATLTTPSP